MLRFAVCDDEPFMLSEVQAQLTSYMKHNDVSCQIDCFSNGGALLDGIKLYDLILLDIQMNPPDGLETARRLRKQGFKGILIFLTVLKENVFDSFETQPFDYLLKPLDHKKFHRTLDRAIKYLKHDMPEKLVIQKNGICQIVPFSEIVYCEILGRKIFLHLANGEVLDYYEKMNDLEQRADNRFFRSHRSYLVNLDHMRGCTRGFAIMLNGNKVPVSRSREQSLIKALLSHMKAR